MRFLAYALALALGALGLLFVFASGQGNTTARVIIGVVCIVAAVAIVIMTRLRPIHIRHEYEQTLHLTGDISLESFLCKNCGAELSGESTHVEAGAVFVRCEYCGGEYQLEEAPKW